nr:GIY-YIG nuclease family protein [Marinobacter sp. UBA3607]
MGRPFSAKVLCTVRLSRALYPEHSRHNMDALITRHNLPEVERHRAMGDVAAMLAFFEHARAEHGSDAINNAIRKLWQRQSTPSNVPAELFAGLPHGPGVYRFYGDNDVLLYVGKSTNIAQRVASHFSGDHQSSRGLRLSESLRSEEELEDFQPGNEPVTFDLDSYKLLAKAVLGKDKNHHRIIELPAVAQPAVLMP